MALVPTHLSPAGSRASARRLKLHPFHVLLLALGLGIGSAEARPYRVLVAHTPRSTSAGKVELGLRHQGLWAGEGTDTTSASASPGNFHQVSASLRVGLFDRFELGFEGSALFYHSSESAPLEVAAGDLLLTSQARLLETKLHQLGLLLRVTFPTGPSAIDVLPPFWSDGTWDVEGLLLYEARLAPSLRMVLNLGYQHHGQRQRDPQAPFDVPDALRWDLALVVHAGRDSLLFCELSGRHYLRRDITPLWGDNNHLIGLRPGFRLELSAGFVLEFGLGIALTRDARQIFLLRSLAGFTYEFRVI